VCKIPKSTRRIRMGRPEIKEMTLEEFFLREEQQTLQEKMQELNLEISELKAYQNYCQEYSEICLPETNPRQEAKNKLVAELFLKKNTALLGTSARLGLITEKLMR
jgi:hypothetical protein